VIALSFIVGYEIYGVGGAVVGTCLVVFLVALLDSVAVEERDPVPAPTTDPPLEAAT
jgi:predicted PurR-regulated permease PerM